MLVYYNIYTDKSTIRYYYLTNILFDIEKKLSPQRLRQKLFFSNISIIFSVF